MYDLLIIGIGVIWVLTLFAKREDNREDKQTRFILTLLVLVFYLGCGTTWYHSYEEHVAEVTALNEKISGLEKSAALKEVVTVEAQREAQEKRTSKMERRQAWCSQQCEHLTKKDGIFRYPIYEWGYGCICGQKV